MARPLIKKDQKGVLYVRPPSIEAKIDEAIVQDWETLSKRAKITDPNAPDFLTRECLVHLIRDAIRRNDQRLATVLMRPLLLRCAANLLKTVPDGAMRDAPEVREDILYSFQMLFTEEAAEDALDYYECKFGSAFKSLRLDRIDAAKSQQKKKPVTDLPQITNEEGGTMPDEEALALLSRAARIGASQEDRLYLPQVLKAVNDLPPDQRRAVVLRRIIGHTEEQTAKICKVDKRTIRYRLARADTQLRKLKEDL
jgi:hypothetical protein